ncbi:MAG: methionyl-tRNA formyltransferase [Bacteroidota bacterium]
MKREKPLRIIFMGSPHFAVPSLDILVQNGYDVVAVITATDKMGGRGGKKLLESAVKKYAKEKGIPILQPKNLKKPEFLEELATYKADLQVVVAFRMLPVVVWDMPLIGTFNLHASLLPKYRGAAPINWAIVAGEKETGATTFFIEHKIDTGNLLFQDKISIGENETAGEVHDRLMDMGAELVLKTVKAIESGDYNPTVQDESLVSHAPKIFHDTCEIDFNQKTETVHNFIRGMSPYPAAWTTLDGLQLNIFRTKKELTDHTNAPGSFITDDKTFLKIATLDGYVNILELQLQGRKKMDTRSFLNGYSFNMNQ